MTRSLTLARCVPLLLSLCFGLYSIHSVAIDCPKHPWQAALYDNGLLGLDGKTGIVKELAAKLKVQCNPEPASGTNWKTVGWI